ncbi:MAG: hypothetical protein P1U57_02335 [Oleibacter sp.]|nr:hypothetical protein [Thalassolituus sp.]
MHGFANSVVKLGCACLGSLLLINNGWANSSSQLTWANDIPSSIDSGDGSLFSSSQLSFSSRIQSTEYNQQRLKVDGSFQMMQFRWQGVEAAQGEYFWLSMPIAYQQKRSAKQEFHWTLEPGLMTDINTLGFSSLAVNASLFGRSFFSPAQFIQYGVIVNRTFGDFNPRPLLAYGTRLTARSELLIGFPRTSFHTRWSSEFNTYISMYPDGGVWREEVNLSVAGDPAATPPTLDGSAPTEKSLHYRTYRVGFGGEFNWQANIALSAEIGQLRLRQIDATDTSGSEVKAKLNDSGYWRLGARMSF